MYRLNEEFKKIETEVQEQMLEYYDGENYFSLDGEYISLVCFAWDEEYEALAWPYRKG